MEIMKPKEVLISHYFFLCYQPQVHTGTPLNNMNLLANISGKFTTINLRGDAEYGA